MIQMGVHDTRQLWERSRRFDMSTKAIRAWARENGFPVEDIGRIKTDVRMAYAEAMERVR